MSRGASNIELGVALVAASVVLVSPARGAEPQECNGLCWSAPPGCPTEQDVRVRIRALTEESAVLESGGFVARVSPRGDEWQVHLRHATHERVITAPACQDLGEAVAVAIALALTPDASNAQATAGTEAHGAARSVDSPSTALDDSALPPAQADDSAQPGETADDSPQPHVATDDLPQPHVATDDLPQPRATTDDTAQASAITPHDSEPIASATEETSQAATSAFDGASLFAAAQWDSNLLPVPTWGARAGAGLSLSRHLTLSVHGVVFNSVKTAIPGAPEAGKAEYDYMGGGIAACWSWPVFEMLVGCTGAEFGGVGASGSELFNSRAQLSLFPSLNVGVKLTPGLESFRFEIGAEGAFPLYRDSFTVDQQQLLHRIPAWTLRLVAGLAFGSR